MFKELFSKLSIAFELLGFSDTISIFSKSKGVLPIK
jgi:hypothetical protein